MALVDDVVTLGLLVSAVFFVVLALGLLIRYKQLSQRISASSDLGRDLWYALEQRMKKQDERILDMMGRVEVVQSRVLATASVQAPASMTPTALPPQPAQTDEQTRDVMDSAPPVQHVASQRQGETSQPLPSGVQLDETQLSAIRLLAEAPKNTRQLTDALGKSREHTARVMKELFEFGLVSRNDATKPFVYQLTDEGKRRV